MSEPILNGTNFNPRYLSSIGSVHWGNGFTGPAFKRAILEIKHRGYASGNNDFLSRFEEIGAESKRADAEGIDILFALGMAASGAGFLGVQTDYAPVPELCASWHRSDNGFEMAYSQEAEELREGQLKALHTAEDRADWVETEMSDGCAGLYTEALKLMADRKTTQGVSALVAALKPSRAPRPAPKPKASKTAKTADIAIDSRPVNA